MQSHLAKHVPLVIERHACDCGHLYCDERVLIFTYIRVDEVVYKPSEF